jgi:hypothetical protein
MLIVREGEGHYICDFLWFRLTKVPAPKAYLEGAEDAGELLQFAIDPTA